MSEYLDKTLRTEEQAIKDWKRKQQAFKDSEAAYWLALQREQLENAL